MEFFRDLLITFFTLGGGCVVLFIRGACGPADDVSLDAELAQNSTGDCPISAQKFQA